METDVFARPRLGAAFSVLTSLALASEPLQAQSPPAPGPAPAAAPASAPSVAASTGPASTVSDAPAVNTGLLFNADVGFPSVQGDGINVSGHAELGYQTERWRARAEGTLTSYGSVSDSSLVTTRRSTATADFWGSFPIGGPETNLRLSAEAGYAGYFTRRLPLDGSFNQFTEQSLMGRFDGLVGFHHHPVGARLGVDLWLGVGAQLEAYSVGEGRVLALPDSVQIQGSFTATVTGRLRAFVYTGRFGRFRLESDLRYFRITKASATLNLDQPITPTGTLQVASQIDFRSELYFDLLFAEFFGFVPVVEIGVDVYSTSSDVTTTQTSVVPNAGIGLRRQVF